MLRARRGIGPRDLALPASANEGPHRQRGRRRQSRRVGRRRSAVHGDRPRARHRAQQVHGRAAVGNRDGRLAPELQRHRRSPPRRQPRRHRHVGRRRRRARIRGGVRSGDRQGSVALVDDAEARRAGVGDVAGQRHRSSRRHDVDDGHVRSGARHRSTGRSAIPVRISSATIGSATTCTRIRSWRSTRRPARSSGTSSSRRTTCGTTTRRKRPRSSTRRGRASRASSSCRPIATATSTCSIARTESFCPACSS